MLIDHIGLNVADVRATREFLLAAGRPLGLVVLREGDGWAMLGRPGEGAYWVGQFGPAQPPLHIAFAAATHEQVRAFHAAALAAGGRDNGAPGLRPQYHPDYYAAFVLGPDGHNYEAVCHAPQD